MGLLVNTLTANYEYSRSNMDNLRLPVQMQLSEKLNTFSWVLISFSQPALNPECFEKNVDLIAQLFLNLLPPKDVFTYLQKSSCFWKSFGSESLNDSLKLLKFAEKSFYPTFSSFWVNLTLKKSFSVRSDILGLLLNTLTSNQEYSCSNTDYLPLPLQMLLSGKLKLFSWYYIPFFRFPVHFQHSQKKSAP